VAEIRSLAIVKKQHSPARPTSVAVVTDHVKSTQAKYGRCLFSSLLPFAPSGISFASLGVTKQPLARLASVAQRMMCVVGHATVRALLR